GGCLSPADALAETLTEASADGLSLDHGGEVETGGGTDAVEHRAHRPGAVAADNAGGAVLTGAADDGDAADGGVALGELGHDRREHVEDSLREECLLVGGDGLGLGFDRGSARLTLGADGLGLRGGADAPGLGLRLG